MCVGVVVGGMNGGAVKLSVCVRAGHDGIENPPSSDPGLIDV